MAIAGSRTLRQRGGTCTYGRLSRLDKDRERAKPVISFHAVAPMYL